MGAVGIPETNKQRPMNRSCVSLMFYIYLLMLIF